MEFTIKSGSPEKQRSACVVVGVFDNRKPSLSAELIDRASGGYVSEIIRRGDMEGKLGSTLLLHNVRGTLADRVLLVGLGKERDFREREFRTAVRAAVRCATNRSYEAVVISPRKKFRTRVCGASSTRSSGVEASPLRRDEEPAEVRRPLRSFRYPVARRDLPPRRGAPARGLAIAHGMNLARDLGPTCRANLHSELFAERAQALAQELDSLLVLDRRSRGAQEGIIPVGTSGSEQPPK